MDIFANKPQKTHQDIVNEQAELLSLMNTNTLEFLKRDHETKMDLIWRNPVCTPQEVFDVYGVHAKKLFYKAEKIVAFIRSEDPLWVPPMPSAYFRINPDGTVTVL
jgi:hypothetical protein